MSLGHLLFDIVEPVSVRQAENSHVLVGIHNVGLLREIIAFHHSHHSRQFILEFAIISQIVG
jgi:hypothetical protein